MVGILLGGPGDSSSDGSLKQRSELVRFNQAKVEHVARRTLLALPTDDGGGQAKPEKPAHEEGGNISNTQSSSIRPSLGLTISTKFGSDEGALVRSPKTKNEGAPVRSPQIIESVKVGVRLKIQMVLEMRADLACCIIQVYICLFMH